MPKFHFSSKKTSLEEQEVQKRGPVFTRKTDHFHDLRRVTGDHDTAWGHADCSLLFFVTAMYRSMVPKWDKVLLSLSKSSSDDILGKSVLVMYTDNSIEFGKDCVKIFPGIIERRYHADRNQMGLLKEQFAV